MINRERELLYQLFRLALAALQIAVDVGALTVIRLERKGRIALLLDHLSQDREFQLLKFTAAVHPFPDGQDGHLVRDMIRG